MPPSRICQSYGTNRSDSPTCSCSSPELFEARCSWMTLIASPHNSLVFALCRYAARLCAVEAGCRTQESNFYSKLRDLLQVLGVPEERLDDERSKIASATKGAGESDWYYVSQDSKGAPMLLVLRKGKGDKRCMVLPAAVAFNFAVHLAKEPGSDKLLAPETLRQKVRCVAVRPFK